MGAGVFERVWSFFMPPDPRLVDLYPRTDIEALNMIEPHVKALYRWRVKVSWTLVCIVVAVIWSFSPPGLVRASDLKGKLDTAVSSAVAAAVRDIKAEQAEQGKQLRVIEERGLRQDMALKELLRGQLANNICRLVVRRQEERRLAERGSLRADLDAEQEKYKAVVGEYYPESRCGGEP